MKIECKIRHKTLPHEPISEELNLVDFIPGDEILFITEFGEDLKREEFEILESIESLISKQQHTKNTHEKVFYIHMQIIKNNE